MSEETTETKYQLGSPVIVRNRAVGIVLYAKTYNKEIAYYRVLVDALELSERATNSKDQNYNEEKWKHVFFGDYRDLLEHASALCVISVNEAELTPFTPNE